MRCSYDARIYMYICIHESKRWRREKRAGRSIRRYRDHRTVAPRSLHLNARVCITHRSQRARYIGYIYMYVAWTNPQRLLGASSVRAFSPYIDEHRRCLFWKCFWYIKQFYFYYYLFFPSRRTFMDNYRLTFWYCYIVIYFYLF